MKTLLLSILLLSTLNCERFNESGARGPALGAVSGPDNVVIYQPANGQRIEPTEFNRRSGAPNLQKQEPTQLVNPIDLETYPREVPSQFASPNAPTILVFDENNAPGGLAEFLERNPGAVVADSIDAVRNMACEGHDDGCGESKPMFDVPKTVTVGVGSPPFPGFNNDVEHLPVTTLMRGENPIDQEEWVEGVGNPSIPGRMIAPIDITDMPATAAIPVRSPNVPSQYKLQPGQPKQGLDFSNIAAAPKIDMPFAPIPNVTKLNIKREPWNVIQKCDAPLVNDCLIKSNTVIPVAEKIITHDKKQRDTKMMWPNKIPAAHVRSTEPQILRLDGDVDLVIEESAPAEALVGSQN